MQTLALDLGCGTNPKNHFSADRVFGIDIRHNLGDDVLRADLSIQGIPFGDNYFDYVTAHDFIEHIPRIVYVPERRNSFVELMNEIWRVLKPQGSFLSVTPAFPHFTAFMDPTHVNIITEHTFPLYFDKDNRWGSNYGFYGAFMVVSQKWQGGHLVSLLQKAEAPESLHPANHEKPIPHDSLAVDERRVVDPVLKVHGSPTSVDSLHRSHWEHFFEDELHSRLWPTWWDPTTANHWRHRRFLEGAIDVLATTEAKWLTIGDGSGHDTWILRREGFRDILTTDISSAALKRSLAEGRIFEFEEANAEALDYMEGSFDFVLCKEALHHMRMPYRAIYEMLRVSRMAVVLIEPQDPYIDIPVLSGPAKHNWERVGNYVFGLSRREYQKVALGLNLPGYAIKNIFDFYEQGCEFHPASTSDPVFRRMVEAVESAEAACKEGKGKYNYLLTILFKDPQLAASELIQSRLVEKGWTYESTCLNPYLRHLK